MSPPAFRILALIHNLVGSSKELSYQNKNRSYNFSITVTAYPASYPFEVTKVVVCSCLFVVVLPLLLKGLLAGNTVSPTSEIIRHLQRHQSAS